MSSLALHITWIALLMVSRSVGEPNVNGMKHKRMAPLLIDRVELVDHDMIELSERDDGSGISTHSSSWESKATAMKNLLAVLDLQIPANLSEFATRGKMKKPPKYMVDLYNAIADDNGITKAPGLLDADTVRSIPNIGPAGTTFCKFNLSAVTDREIVIDAELHLFQSLKNNRVLKDNFALHTSHIQHGYPTTQVIKIFQLYSGSNSTHQMKKLISARRVHSHHGGWHIFSILPTVASWISSGSPNYGLSAEIHASNGKIIENVLERDSLQPILIIFTNYSKVATNHSQPEASTAPPVHRKQIEDVEASVTNRRVELASSRNKRSAKKARAENNNRNNRTDDRKSRRGRNRIMDSVQEKRVESPRADDEGTEYYQYTQKAVNPKWTEENVYPRSDMRFGRRYEDIVEYISDGSDNTWTFDNPIETTAVKQQPPRDERRPYMSFTSVDNPGKVMRNCRRFPLYVNFEEMGWSGWIIHPQGYNAYHCKGVCSFPLGQQLNPTNHATVQSIMHTLGLGNQAVEMPCCAPDKLYDINLLYFDQNDYVVLRRYQDMVAASCSCR